MRRSYLMSGAGSWPQPMSQCYHPAARKRNFPNFTYRHLCTVAINIAIAVNTVHGRNYVIGGITESSILIDDHGLVTLIDTGSVQVIDPSDRTICRNPVGKPEYTPPELQGHSSTPWLPRCPTSE